MFRKILLCSDLSAASDALVSCVGDLQQLGLEEVILLHVVYAAVVPGLENALRAEATKKLTQYKEQLEELGLRVQIDIPLGMPVYAIEEEASNYEVDAIVIGSRGESLLRAAALGSVSFKVLQIARCPVLLVRVKLLDSPEGEGVAPCQRLFTSLLVPYDFSALSALALQKARDIAMVHGCPIRILHVNDNQRRLTYLSAEAMKEQDAFDEERLCKLRDALIAEGLSVSHELVEGVVLQEILKRAHPHDTSLIIMGNQGKGFLREAVLGSVANEVARQAEVPVLYVTARS